MQEAQAAMLRVSMQGRAGTLQHSKTANRALTPCACCLQDSGILQLSSTLCRAQLTTAPLHVWAASSATAQSPRVPAPTCAGRRPGTPDRHCALCRLGRAHQGHWQQTHGRNGLRQREGPGQLQTGQGGSTGGQHMPGSSVAEAWPIHVHLQALPSLLSRHQRLPGSRAAWTRPVLGCGRSPQSRGRAQHVQFSGLNGVAVLMCLRCEWLCGCVSIQTDHRCRSTSEGQAVALGMGQQQRLARPRSVSEAGERSSRGAQMCVWQPGI